MSARPLSLFALLTAAAWLPAAVCARPAPKPGAQPGQVKDLVIQGETRIKIKADKPAEPPELDSRAPLENHIVSYIRENNPAEQMTISYPLYLPSRLGSDLVLSAWQGRVVTPPVLSLLVKSPPDVKVYEWRLIITGDQGKVFRTISGKGSVPPSITWDGLGESGELLFVGRPYAYALSVLDENAVPTYLFGKSVTVKGYLHKRVNQISILLDTEMLFTRSLAFSNNGYAYLRETQDKLRKYTEWKITVNVYRDDQDLAQRQAELFRDYLETELRLKKGGISAKGYPADKSRYSRTEITAVKY